MTNISTLNPGMIAELSGSIKVSQGAMNYYYGNYIFGMHITPSTPFPRSTSHTIFAPLWHPYPCILI